MIRRSEVRREQDTGSIGSLWDVGGQTDNPGHAPTSGESPTSVPAQSGALHHFGAYAISAPESHLQDANPLVQRAVQHPPRLSPGGAETGPDLDAQIRSASGGGSPLQAGVQQRLESGLGADLSGVRIHADAEADVLSRAVSAEAFTAGSDIFFRSGAYNPSSQEGLQTLAHEATHTIQQKAGPVAGTPAPGGISVSDPADEFEQEASRAAAQVASGGQANVQRSAAEGGGDLSVQRTGVTVQRIAPAVAAFFAGLNTAAWSTAANVASIVSAVGGAAAGAAQVVAREENRFGSYVFPTNVMSDSDKYKLQQIAQAEIINKYVDLYLAAHPEVLAQMTAAPTLGPPFFGPPAPGPFAPPPAGPFAPSGPAGGAPAPAPAPTAGAPERPTGAPTAAAIDQLVLESAALDVKRKLETAMENAARTTGKEFMWGEDDTRAEGDLDGTRGEEESAGVTGTITFRNMQAIALKVTLTLSDNAKAVGLNVAGNGEEVVVHKFVGGTMDGRCTWSAWDNLTVNVIGSQAQPVVGPNGAPKFILRTEWYWDQFGPNSTTTMENHIHVADDGAMVITAMYDPSGFD